MNFYRVARYDGDNEPAWAMTLAEAHDVLKAFSHMPEARVELFDVPTAKHEVCYLLNRGRPEDRAKGPERTWCLTPRRGLKEIPNGE